MNSIRNEIKLQAAAFALEMSKQWGDLATFAHEGETPINIHVVPMGEELQDEGSGDTDMDVRTKSFEVPAQPNFPPYYGITTGDEIVYEGRKWQIDKVTKDSVGAKYKLDCVNQRVTALRGE